MYVVTGATGQLGRLTIEELLRTVPADQVVAAVRAPEKAADLAARGVQVREADYDRPETLRAAFEGARKVLLISGNEIGRRVPQHQAAVDAARQAGAELLAYTSILHADATPISLGPDHRATEEYLRGSGLPFSLLRNGWYHENYVPSAQQAVATGTLIGSAGDGRVASAARADYAAAAAAVLTGDNHDNTVYELSGDTAWSMPELAAILTEISGTPVTYQDLPNERHTEVLLAAGLPEPVATMFAGFDARIADGWLADTPGTLATLIGRPTTPLRATLAAELKG
ncbi:SDR family oxidoreductase [Micromonospora sp. GCM10011542]|uniref:SDR family oxidoreductase n=1 Tax=Micromonospora sp. GCM10011542 TaxID=3317337 RepID=UPI0036196CA3